MDPYGWLYLDASWFSGPEKIKDVVLDETKFGKMIEDRRGGFRYPDLRP